MSSTKAQSLPADLSGLGDGRKHPRHRSDVLTCHLGKIQDLSVTGMRVQCKRNTKITVGQTGVIEIASPGGKLPVKGTIVWIRRSGLFKLEAGVRFLQLDAPTVAALNNVAMFGFVPRQWKPQSKPATNAAPVQSHYQVLGVAIDASFETIHSAYRELARIYHPDHNKSPVAPAKFMQLQQAYNVLKSTEQRAKYDQTLSSISNV